MNQVSIREDQPGYEDFVRNGAWLVDWKVFLNGNEISDVVTADIDEGWVCRYARDDDNKLRAAEGGSCVADEIVQGAVVVECWSKETGEMLQRWERVTADLSEKTRHELMQMEYSMFPGCTEEQEAAEAELNRRGILERYV